MRSFMEMCSRVYLFATFLLHDYRVIVASFVKNREFTYMALSRPISVEPLFDKTVLINGTGCGVGELVIH